jgi:predicted ferric reductase
MAVIWAGMMLYIRVIKPWIMLQHPYELKEVIEERGSSWTLTLAPVGHKGLTFMPGQVAWLTVQRSPFSIRQHPFSFSSSAEHRSSFSSPSVNWGFHRYRQRSPDRERVFIDGPYGTFDIDQHAAPGYVFLAGGIGSAPIMSMLRTLADRGDTRPLYFFYGSQTWESVIYREELESLEEELDLRLVHVLQRPPEEWTGETGFITTEVLARHLPEDRVAFVYFICGPLPMIAAVERSLEKLHIPISHVHSEQYDMA